MLLGQDLLTNSFRNFIRNIKNPTNTNSLIRFRALREFTIRRTIGNFNRIILVILKGHNRQIPGSVSNLSITILSNRVSISKVLTSQTMLTISQMITILMITNILLIKHNNKQIIIQQTKVKTIKTVKTIQLKLQLLFLQLLNLTQITNMHVIRQHNLKFTTPNRRHTDRSRSNHHRYHKFLRRVLFNRVRTPWTPL